MPARPPALEQCFGRLTRRCQPTEGSKVFTSVGEAAGTGYALSRASASAFGLGEYSEAEYSEALRLGRAGYQAFTESNHRWGLITALCRIGFAALALGDPIEAADTLRTALERARTSEAISLELLALSGIGAVLAETGKHEQATPILIFALGHEQLPPAYDYARPALRTLEAQTSPEDLDHAPGCALSYAWSSAERETRVEYGVECVYGEVPDDDDGADDEDERHDHRQVEVG